MSTINLCPQNITTPDRIAETCDGIYTSDNCITHPEAITELNLPINSSVNSIVKALVLAILYKEEQIQDLTARVEALENP